MEIRTDRYVPTPRLSVALPPQVEQKLEQLPEDRYYDAESDAAARQAYYGQLKPNGDKADFFDRLSALLSDTHQPLDYDPRGYNWVHMGPDMRLQPLYGDQVEHEQAKGLIRFGLPPVSARKLRRSPGAAEKALSKLQQEAEELSQVLASSPLDAVQIALRLAEFESKRYFNMEHVVPKFWFDSLDTPKGDLHILYPEVKCRNSFRGNLPLRDLPGDGDQRVEGKAFEPKGGKGIAARVTLYFLVRYPHLIGGPEEITMDDVKQLIRFSDEDPPGVYERHHNAEAQREQHNRNPFIDHPEWVHQVDFSRGLKR